MGVEPFGDAGNVTASFLEFDDTQRLGGSVILDQGFEPLRRYQVGEGQRALSAIIAR